MQKQLHISHSQWILGIYQIHIKLYWGLNRKENWDMKRHKKYEELNKFIKYPIIIIFRLNWGEKHILETIVENVNKKTTSKILVNILYMIISMLIRFIFVLIPVIVNICGIDFSGKNFLMYLLQGFIVFSIIFFIKFKTIEKHQKK